jgi:hypothetical protein
VPSLIWGFGDLDAEQEDHLIKTVLFYILLNRIYETSCTPRNLGVRGNGDSGDVLADRIYT